MDEFPQFVYDNDERIVRLESGETSVQVYSDVDLEEFEYIRKIDEFVTEASSLFDEMLQITLNQLSLSAENTYFDRLNEFQQRAATYYRRCAEYQDEISEIDSDVVASQLEPLYKLDKFLKHFFRALTIAQSLAFSQRLVNLYVRTEDYLFLYGLVRNVCSTVEYLGNLMESRMGEGKIDLDDTSVNAREVYEEVKRQRLDDVFNPDQEVRIPPTLRKMRLENIGLSSGSMRYLWKKRCDIVHDCPLVVDGEAIDQLPDEIVSTSVITASDVKKLTELSFRLHFHSLSMFLNFVMSYMEKMVEGLVDSIYYER